jgi:hypothetical protein
MIFMADEMHMVNFFATSNNKQVRQGNLGLAMLAVASDFDSELSATHEL